MKNFVVGCVTGVFGLVLLAAICEKYDLPFVERFVGAFIDSFEELLP